VKFSFAKTNLSKHEINDPIAEIVRQKFKKA